MAVRPDILRVFLASPSDLEPERTIAKAVVDRLNRYIARQLNLVIDLLVWEDVLPGYDRPQGKIDSSVDVCDLFVGVLWARWGTPTGKYDSGFEEEFSLAQARAETTKNPEIWVYFKKLDERQRRDPGEQLKMVLAFREALERQQKCFFRQFSDEREWENLFYDHLAAYLVCRFVDRTPVSGYSTEKPGTVPPSFIPEAVSGERFTHDIAMLAERFASTIGQGVELDLSDRVRLLLLASALFAERYQGNLLGSHEVNLIYRQKTWLLTGSERRLILRCMLGLRGDICPGWRWFSLWDESKVNEVVEGLARTDPEEYVRYSAFSLMADLRLTVSKDTLERGLADYEPLVRIAAVKALRSTGDVSYLELLSNVLRDTETVVQQAAGQARIEMLFSADPRKGLEELVSSGLGVPAGVRERFESDDILIDGEVLRALLDRSAGQTRSLIAGYLRKKGELREDACRKLLLDPSRTVRKEAILGLVELGVPFDKGCLEGMSIKTRDEAILIMFEDLAKHDPAQLGQYLDWYEPVAHIAYGVLAERQSEIVMSRIRPDLAERFRGLEEQSKKRIMERFGESGKAITDRPIDDFVRGRLVAAALTALVANGVPEDVKFARDILGTMDSEDVDVAAIKLLRKFGDSSDSERLIKIAGTGGLKVQRAAVEAALKLSPGIHGMLPSLFDNEDSTIRRIGGRVLIDDSTGEATALSQELLTSVFDDVREAAIAHLVRHNDRASLEGLLSEYVGRAHYYYNVVTWLDRCLYAPGDYRDVYERSLQSRFEYHPPDQGSLLADLLDM